VTDAERSEFQNEAKRVQACSAALSRLQKMISKLSKDDQEDLPQEIQDEIQKANDQLYEHQKWTVDFFVTGWKHQTLELPELQGKPSSYFKINEIPELATAIQRLYPILTGIKTDEGKN
jgi:Zn-dependent oligopeptidase